MAVVDERPAGEFLRQRYRSLYRAWLRRVAWILPLAGLYMFGVVIAVGYAIDGANLDRWLAAGAGAGGTIVLWLATEPPERIARLKRGWEGERRTASRLAKVLRGTAWRVEHDVERRFGNFDHVAYGPDGVFLLETKNLIGELSVHGDRLEIRHREDPDAVAFGSDAIARQARGAAKELKERIEPAVGRTWVQAVVVLWGSFPQGRVDGDRVLWVHGDRLDEVFGGQPPRRRPLDPDEIAQRLRDPQLAQAPRSVAPPR